MLITAELVDVGFPCIAGMALKWRRQHDFGYVGQWKILDVALHIRGFDRDCTSDPLGLPLPIRAVVLKLRTGPMPRLSDCKAARHDDDTSLCPLPMKTDIPHAE